MPAVPLVKVSASVKETPGAADALAGVVMDGAVEAPGVALLPPVIPSATASPAVAPAPQVLVRLTLPWTDNSWLPWWLITGLVSRPSIAVTLAVHVPIRGLAGIGYSYSKVFVAPEDATTDMAAPLTTGFPCASVSSRVADVMSAAPKGSLTAARI